jgi:hypothetical protein
MSVSAGTRGLSASGSGGDTFHQSSHLCRNCLPRACESLSGRKRVGRQGKRFGPICRSTKFIACRRSTKWTNLSRGWSSSLDMRSGYPQHQSVGAEPAGAARPSAPRNPRGFVWVSHIFAPFHSAEDRQPHGGRIDVIVGVDDIVARAAWRDRPRRSGQGSARWRRSSGPRMTLI